MKFNFEAMDATGQEIRDVIEANDQNAAQAGIRQMGYFVTKIWPAERRTVPNVLASLSSPLPRFSSVSFFRVVGLILPVIGVVDLFVGISNEHVNWAEVNSWFILGLVCWIWSEHLKR